MTQERLFTETTGFVLWFRLGKPHRWKAVASAERESELTAHYGKLPSGEVMTLPGDEDPNETRSRK